MMAGPAPGCRRYFQSESQRDEKGWSTWERLDDAVVAAACLSKTCSLGDTLVLLIRPKASRG